MNNNIGSGSNGLRTHQYEQHLQKTDQPGQRQKQPLKTYLQSAQHKSSAIDAVLLSNRKVSKVRSTQPYIQEMLRGKMLLEMEQALKDNKKITVYDETQDNKKLEKAWEDFEKIFADNDNREILSDINFTELLNEVDKNEPEQLAEIIVDLSNSIRKDHFRRDFQAALPKLAPVMVIDRSLKSILKIFEVSEPEDLNDSGIFSDDGSVDDSASDSEKSTDKQDLTTQTENNSVRTTQTQLNPFNGDRQGDSSQTEETFPGNKQPGQPQDRQDGKFTDDGITVPNGPGLTTVKRDGVKVGSEADRREQPVPKNQTPVGTETDNLVSASQGFTSNPALANQMQTTYVLPGQSQLNSFNGDMQEGSSQTEVTARGNERQTQQTEQQDNLQDVTQPDAQAAGKTAPVMPALTRVLSEDVGGVGGVGDVGGVGSIGGLGGVGSIGGVNGVGDADTVTVVPGENPQIAPLSEDQTPGEVSTKTNNFVAGSQALTTEQASAPQTSENHAQPVPSSSNSIHGDMQGDLSQTKVTAQDNEPPAQRPEQQQTVQDVTQPDVQDVQQDVQDVQAAEKTAPVKPALTRVLSEDVGGVGIGGLGGVGGVGSIGGLGGVGGVNGVGDADTVTVVPGENPQIAPLSEDQTPGEVSTKTDNFVSDSQALTTEQASDPQTSENHAQPVPSSSNSIHGDMQGDSSQTKVTAQGNEPPAQQQILQDHPQADGQSTGITAPVKPGQTAVRSDNTDHAHAANDGEVVPRAGQPEQGMPNGSTTAQMRTENSQLTPQQSKQTQQDQSSANGQVTVLTSDKALDPQTPENPAQPVPTSSNSIHGDMQGDSGQTKVTAQGNEPPAQRPEQQQTLQGHPQAGGQSAGITAPVKPGQTAMISDDADDGKVVPGADQSKQGMPNGTTSAQKRTENNQSTRQQFAQTQEDRSPANGRVTVGPEQLADNHGEPVNQSESENQDITASRKSVATQTLVKEYRSDHTEIKQSDFPGPENKASDKQPAAASQANPLETKAREEADSLKSQVQSLQRDLANAQAEMRERSSDAQIKQELNDALEKVAQLRQTNEEQLAELGELRTSASEAQRLEAEAKTEMDNLKLQVESLERDKAETLAEMWKRGSKAERLEQELEYAQNERNKIDGEQRDELVTLRDEARTAKRLQEESSAETKIQLKRISELERELEEAKKKEETVSELQRKLANNQTRSSKEIDQLQKRLNLAEAANEQKEELKAKLAMAEEKAVKIQKLEKEAESLKGQVRDLESTAYQDQQARENQSSELKKTHEHEKAQLQVELDELKRQLQEAEALKQKIPGLESKLQSMEILANERTDLKQQLENKEKALSELLQVQAQLEKTEDESDRKKAGLEADLARERAEAGEKVTGLEQQVELLKAEVSDLKSTIDHEQHKKESLEGELMTARGRSTSQQAELDSENQELAATRSPLEKIHDQENQLEAAKKQEDTVSEFPHQPEDKHELSLKPVDERPLKDAEAATGQAGKPEEQNADLAQAQATAGNVTLQDQVTEGQERQRNVDQNQEGSATELEQSPGTLQDVNNTEVPDPDSSNLTKSLRTLDLTGLSGLISGINKNNNALQTTVKSITHAVSEYNKAKESIEKSEDALDIKSEDEPSKIVSRNKIKGEIVRLRETIDNLFGEFKRKYDDPIKNTEDTKLLETKIEEIKTDLSKQLEQIEASNNRIRNGKVVQEWREKIPGFNAGNQTPDSYLNEVMKLLTNIFQSDNNDEVKNYLAGKTIKSAAEQLVNRCAQEIKNQPHIEQQKLFMSYSRILGLLDPVKLHERVHQGKFTRKGRLFASGIVKEKTGTLDGLFPSTQKIDPRPRESANDKVRREQAEGMIKDDRIRPMLLALINSVKPKHENVENLAVTDNLRSALATGLLDIRDQFNLHPMPDMNAVLRACADDLEKPNSRLAVESAYQHRDTLHDKANQPRHQKLQTRCRQIRKELSPNSHSKRQQKSQAIPENISKVMRDFQDPKGILDTDTLQNSQFRREGSFEIRSLAGGGSLLNAFFKGASGANWRKADEGAESIAIDGGKPAGVTFEKNSAGAWQAMLGNKYYTIHPRFLYQFPDIAIPFEDHWLPVKADDGKTGILVLQNTGDKNRYFLYEPDGQGQLKPKPIDASNEHEMVDAEFFRRAAEGPTNSKVISHGNYKNQKVAANKAQQLTAGIKWIGNKWNNKNSQLVRLYHQVKQEIDERKGLHNLIGIKDQSQFLNDTKVRESQYTLLLQKKQDRGATGSTMTDASLASDNQCYETLSVDASFDKIGSSYFRRFAEQFGSNALVELGQSNLKKFKDGAFQQISVFKGCEINPRAEAQAPGSIQQVELNLEKVVKVNRDRQFRLNQGVDYLTRTLGKALRENQKSADKLKTYRDDELVDFAINRFKSGKLPKGVETRRFCDDLVQLMLIKNERDFSVGMGHRLEGLKNKLIELKIGHYQSLVITADEFTTACQKWNLDMALLAGEQIEANARINHYYSNGLSEQNRVMMSFERGGLMLRGNQSEMAKRVFEFVKGMGEKDKDSGSQNLIFQLGTGYGKSKTVIPLAADQAYRKGYPVRIIAPALNQAELDNSLYHYFADQGIKYRRLDIFKDYVEPALGSVTGGQWWSTRNLNAILKMVKQKPPLGISTKDVQLLMTLRDKLKQAQNARKEVDILDKIVDALQYSGLNIFDEYDRSVMPGRADELEELTDDINRALADLNAPIEPEEVATVQSAFLSGSKHKICLSATMGTGFTMTALTKSETVNEAAEKCKSDPMTTNARFFHWLTKTTPVVSEGTSSKEQRVTIFKSAMERSGKDKQIILFDGNDEAKTEASRFSGVQKDYQYLREARGKARGLLYYNDRRELCLYDPQQEKYQEPGVRVSPELEHLIRKHPEQYDVRLDRTQGVGTDCPQSPESVGIHFGMLEDANRRSNLLLQEFGRFSRKSGNFRQQDFYMVIDPSVNQDPDSIDFGIAEEHKKVVDQYIAAHQNTEKAKKALVTALGKSAVSELSPQQQRVINSLLHVSPPDDQDSHDANLERDLGKFIDSWECNDFPEGAKQALTTFKRAQWVEQNDFLEMTAAVMALRENSLFVRGCEESLELGVMRSEADEILSKAHTWLDAGAKKVLTDIDLTSLSSKVTAATSFDRSVFNRELTSQLQAAVHSKLMTIERETFDQNKTLLEVASSQHIEDKITRCIDELGKGIEYVSSSTKTEIPSNLFTHCKELKEQADTIFKQIRLLCNDGQPSVKANIANKKEIKLIVTKNWDQLTQLKTQLDVTFENLKGGNRQAAINFCRENNSTLERFYKALAIQISKLTFQNYLTNNEGFRRLCEALAPVFTGLKGMTPDSRRNLQKHHTKPGTTLEFELVKDMRPNGWEWTVELETPKPIVMVELETIKQGQESDNALTQVENTLANKENKLQPYLTHIKDELLRANEKHQTLLTRGAKNAQEKIAARSAIKLK